MREGSWDGELRPCEGGSVVPLLYIYPFFPPPCVPPPPHYFSQRTLVMDDIVFLVLNGSLIKWT